MKHSYSVRKLLLSALFKKTALCLALLPAIGSLHAQTLPPNIDFGLGNFTTWSCYVGEATTGTPTTGAAFINPVLSGPVAKRHTIMTGTGTDAIGGFPIVAPGGGTYSAKIGLDSPNFRAERIRYQVHVPVGTTKFNLICQYAVVFEDPAHLPEEQPTFQVVAYDSATGAVIPTANNLYVSRYIIPGFIPYTSPLTPGYYLPWTPTTVNLSGYGGNTVTIECTALACALGGHFGYGYFDVTSFSTYLAPTVVSCNLGTNSIILKGPAGYKYYQWFDQSFSTALSSPLDTNSVQSLNLPASAQYYNLVVYPYASTGLPDTVRTNVLGSFTINATPKAACAMPGSPVQLNTTVTGGAGNFKYQWSGGSGLSALNVPNPVANPSSASTYIVKVSDTSGCFRTDTVRTYKASFQMSAGPDKTTCLGTAVSLSATVTPAAGSYTYTWTPAGGLSSASVLSPSYSPAATGTQQFVLNVDSAGCSRTDTVSVHTLPNTFSVSDTTVCAGTGVVPQVAGDTAFSFSWSPATKLTFASPAYPGSDQKPSFAADSTTTFTITASNAACSIVKSLTVNVEPVPIVNIGTTDTVYKSASFPIALSASVTPASFSPYTYSWSTSPYVDSPASANINFSGPSDTTLYVTVTTPAGCSSADAVYISVSSASIMAMPNAFVPNSSLAKNAMLRIASIRPGYTLRSMRIYNRWGKLVYQTTNAADGWDGMLNGTAAPMGVYVYMLEAASAKGEVVRQQGNVTLLR